jgi:transposase
VVIGIETAHGLLPQLLIAAGYQMYVVNPLAASRYRERHAVSGAKSDAGDSKMLADLVRTDRHNHRRYLGDTDLAAATKVLARSHKQLIWLRQRHINQLRSTLRVYYPAILGVFVDLGSTEALALLDRAATPTEGRSLSQSKIRSLVEAAGRKRGVEVRVQTIQAALRSPQLEAPVLLTRAYGTSVRALVALLRAVNTQIASLESELTQSFERHSDAEIIRSLPGLGAVLGARVLAEFGDEPTRFVDGRARKNYAGTSPITRASGKKKAVSARYVRNQWLADALERWAFSSLRGSPGARSYYDALRARH